VPQAGLRLADSPLEQTGALLITHWGLSGPAALKLSAWAARVLHEKNYLADLRVNWLAGQKLEEVLARLRAARQAHPRKTAAGTGLMDIPRRLWARLVESAGIPAGRPWSGVSNALLLALAGELQDGRYRMTGKSVFKEEFVTCGGVCLDEVDFRTLESKRCPGLYFAGETLDIDGVTGGFNFQSAWTTGSLAGRAAGAAP
jgi:predicted Rossmann fold flavoprotein